ncbi:MAG: serine hydrolase, partial [Actinomycetota bacterium]
MPDSLDAAWRLADAFPVDAVSVAVINRHGTFAYGDADRPQRIASVSKPLAAWAVLVAVEEGSVSLDDPVGQEGCTLRHLLAHAGGYPFDGAEPDPRGGLHVRSDHVVPGVRVDPARTGGAHGLGTVEGIAAGVGK